MAGTLLFKKVFAATSLIEIFDCKKCESDQKKSRGCKKKKRRPIIEVDCICDGAKKCGICGGRKNGNAVKVYRCPHVSLFDISVSRILPYFYHWIASEFMAFPDGKGRYYQPKKILSAFDILLSVKNRETLKERKEDNGSQGTS